MGRGQIEAGPRVVDVPGPHCREEDRLGERRQDKEGDYGRGRSCAVGWARTALTQPRSHPCRLGAVVSIVASGSMFRQAPEASTVTLGSRARWTTSTISLTSRAITPMATTPQSPGECCEPGSPSRRWWN